MRNSLLAVLITLAAVTPASAKWREASTDHFVIYSEESEKSLRDFAARLEKYDSAMRELRGVPYSNPGPANRLTVYVVSNVDKVRRLSGEKGNFVAGFYVPRASGSVAIIPRRVGDGSKWDLDAETVLLHEYAHHFFAQNHKAAFPAWYIEGYAEFHSTAKFERDGAVGLGLPALHRAGGLIIGNPLPLDRLLSHDPEKLTPIQREALYGRGWLLTHYLTFEPSRKGQLSDYLIAINNGKAGAEAAGAAFGDLKTLDRELDAYIKRRSLHYVAIAANRIRTGEISMREVGPGENALMDVKIRSRRGVNREQAQALLVEARRLSVPFPNDVSVQTTLAEAEYDAGNYKEAEAAADRALAVDPKAVNALIYKGRAKMRMAAASGAEADWKEARRWIAAANRADPDDPEPMILFYTSFGEQGIKPTANSVEGLTFAHSLAPEDRGLRMMVARQYLIDGKTKEARAMLGPIAYDPHGGEMGQAAALVIASIDAGQAAKALEALRATSDEDLGEESGGDGS